MDPWRYLLLKLFFYYLLTVVCSLQIQFDDVVGNTGSNDTTLRCAFRKSSEEESIQFVALSARNISTSSFSLVALFQLDKEGKLVAGGKYLSGRVILSNLTSLSTDVTLTFKDLQCDLETSFICSISYINIQTGGLQNDKEHMNLTVAVNPSVPNVMWDELTVSDGDNVTFTCIGNVGKPPRTFFWQKEDANAVYVSYRNVTTESAIVEDSCFFNGTSTLTIQVTEYDNDAVIRCSVNNSNDEVYHTQTQALDVIYTARKPFITRRPMHDVYPQGTPHIKLTCIGRGNPQPSYVWFKDGNMNEILNSTNTLYITDVVIKNSGVYRCNASNNISGIEYTKSTTVHIRIVKEKNTTPTTAPTTTGKEVTTDANTDKSEDVIPVLAGVGGGVLFLLVIVIICCCLYRRKRSNSNNKEIFREHTVRNVEGYDSVHLDKGNGIRDKHAQSQSHHNQAYSPNDSDKTAEENMNKENDTQGLDTRNEYASVNEATKLKNRTIGKMPVENQRKSNQDDMEDPYMESKDNTYAHLGEKHQHKTAETTEMYAKAGELTDRL